MVGALEVCSEAIFRRRRRRSRAGAARSTAADVLEQLRRSASRPARSVNVRCGSRSRSGLKVRSSRSRRAVGHREPASSVATSPGGGGSPASRSACARALRECRRRSPGAGSGARRAAASSAASGRARWRAGVDHQAVHALVEHVRATSSATRPGPADLSGSPSVVQPSAATMGSSGSEW